MWKNVKILYNSYGGFVNILKSPYFIISVMIAIFGFKPDVDNTWANISVSIMPSIIIFSLMSIAIIIFATDGTTRNILLIKEKSNTSPLIKMISYISHAIITQTFSLIFAYVILTLDKNSLLSLIINVFFGGNSLIIFVCIFSFIGKILFLYGLMLVFAEILSIFRFLFILSECAVPCGSA